MVLRPTPGASEPIESAVVWHDLECGSYRADLPLWLTLADEHPAGAILDVGAGTGRVALELARHGRRVIALDHDAALLAELRRRAEQATGQHAEATSRRAERPAIETICADARSFALPGGERVSLCIAPMQTVQLLGGAIGRGAFLRRALAHLRPGGLLACALVTDLEPFDCSEEGGLGPTPERCRIDGVLYISQATRVAVAGEVIAIERHRSIDDSSVIERDLIELDRVTVAELEREAQAIGLHPEPARQIPTTADHAGSDVVMLRV